MTYYEGVLENIVLYNIRMLVPDLLRLNGIINAK